MKQVPGSGIPQCDKKCCLGGFGCIAEIKILLQWNDSRGMPSHG